MIRVITAACLGAAMLLVSGGAMAHPYTTWKEDGMTSDAHTHINSGDYHFSLEDTGGTAAVAVGQGSYYSADGVLVTSQGYYLNDGTFVEGRYVEGSVFSGGAVAVNTVVTGGGIVSLYGYEETRTTTTTKTSGNATNSSVELTAEQRGGRFKRTGHLITAGAPFQSMDRVFQSTPSRAPTPPSHAITLAVGRRPLM